MVLMMMVIKLMKLIWYVDDGDDKANADDMVLMVMKVRRMVMGNIHYKNCSVKICQ